VEHADKQRPARVGEVAAQRHARVIHKILVYTEAVPEDDNARWSGN
jgi:hypothetical protein